MPNLGEPPRLRRRSETPAPFAVDSWPLCEPYERAGRLTLRDTLDLDQWTATAELQLRLEIDRRFDALLDHVRATSWPSELG